MSDNDIQKAYLVIRVLEYLRTYIDLNESEMYLERHDHKIVLARVHNLRNNEMWMNPVIFTVSNRFIILSMPAATHPQSQRLSEYKS